MKVVNLTLAILISFILASSFYRYVCPKGYSFDKFTQEIVNGVFSNINSYIRESLKWKSPCQIVTETLGDAFLKGTGLTMISPKDVVLRPLF